MTVGNLQIKLPEAPESITALRDYEKLFEDLDDKQNSGKLTGSVQIKNGTLYLLINLHKGDKRQQLWISTKLKAKGNATRAKSMLSDMLGYIKTLVAVKADIREKNLHELSVWEDSQKKTLFADVMLKWLESKKGYIAESTYLSYHQLVSYILPYFRDKGIYVEDMTAKDIDDLAELQRANGLKVETVKRYRAVISGAVHYALNELKLIQHDIMADVKQHKKPKSEIFTGDYYNEDELKILLESIEKTKLELPIWLGGFYGLRRSEVIGLRWSQIDFNNDLLSINYTVTPALLDGKTIEYGAEQTKTDKSRRSLPLEEPLKSILLRRKNEIEQNRKMFGNCYNEEYLDFVCVDDFGNRLKLDYVSGAYPKLLKKIGLRRIRFHDLRHTSASMLIKAGQNLTDVMCWLGHSSFKTTQRYSHLEALSKKESSTAMRNLLFD